MNSTPDPKQALEEPGFVTAITAAQESEENILSVPEIGERVAAAVGIDADLAIRAVQIVQEYAHGPIPSAIELERLNSVAHALGTDIARDYLAQRTHDRQMDLKLAELATGDSARKDGWLQYAKRGQIFGIFSQLVFVGGAFYAMYLHDVPLAILLVAAPALGVVTQFIKGFEGAASGEQQRDSAKPKQSEVVK